jgi:hypothetical protein
VSYHLNIERADPPALGDVELQEKLPKLRGFKSSQQTSSCVIYNFKPDGLADIAVFWRNGNFWAERVEDAHVPFLASLAAHLDAELVGDEGEIYALNGEVKSRPARAEHSKRLDRVSQFLRRNIVTIVVLLLFAIAASIMQLAGV